MGVSTGALSGCNEITDSDIKYVGLPEVESLMRQAERDRNRSVIALIDARAPNDFASGHLPGATNLLLYDVPEVGAKDPRIAVYGNIVVYGSDAGHAGAKGLTKRMMKVGYEDVRLFAGGLEEWLNAGMPTETGAEPRPDDR